MINEVNAMPIWIEALFYYGAFAFVLSLARLYAYVADKIKERWF